MKTRILCIQILFLAVLIPVFCFSQDAQSVFSQIQKKYGEGQTLSVQFTEKDNTPAQGKLTVKRGNKFIIEIADRTVVCNGATVWNYQPSKSKVIVSNYVDAGDAISPEKIFLTFPKNYQPTLKKESRSIGEGFLTLTLTPSSQQETVGGLQKIIMRVQPGTLKLQELEISDGVISRLWLITDIKIVSDMSDKAFEFEAPPSVRVLDLR